MCFSVLVLVHVMRLWGLNPYRQAMFNAVGYVGKKAEPHKFSMYTCFLGMPEWNLNLDSLTDTTRSQGVCQTTIVAPGICNNQYFQYTPPRYLRIPTLLRKSRIICWVATKVSAHFLIS
jgi:hypothetical protein